MHDVPEVTIEEASMTLDWYRWNGVPNGIEARLARYALRKLREEADDA